MIVQCLRMLGCASGQGYLYGRAMPAADFTALVRNGSESPLHLVTAAAG
jgi:EAL domain-containing protein (putative c-di-GMP-specific phosphodiesterase class I)